MPDKNIARLEKFLHSMAVSIAQDFHAVRKSISILGDRVGELENRLEVRFDVVEGKIERVARQLDDEAEMRHQLGERVSKIEKAIQKL